MNNKKEEKNLGVGCAVVLVIIALIWFWPSGSDKTQTKILTPEEQRLERIKKQFSSWDGSHIKLTQVVKDLMNDPKSFEHKETRYIDQGDTLQVLMVFRGKNVFGGVVENYVRATVDLDGNVLEINEWGP